MGLIKRRLDAHAVRKDLQARYRALVGKKDETEALITKAKLSEAQWRLMQAEFNDQLVQLRAAFGCDQVTGLDIFGDGPLVKSLELCHTTPVRKE